MSESVKKRKARRKMWKASAPPAKVKTFFDRHVRAAMNAAAKNPVGWAVVRVPPTRDMLIAMVAATPLNAGSLHEMELRFKAMLPRKIYAKKPK